VSHTTGIPHSPTGQAIVERAHQELKKTLEHQGSGVKTESPMSRLSHAMFTLNFLNCSFDNPNPPVVRHFQESSSTKLREKPPVLVRDPESWE
ncbi:POK19 protein, partial [Spizella passerina]|nr:POK19 protein [Spizella passerina]